jgi:hypothetical protein
MKSYLDTHLRGVHKKFSYSKYEIIFGYHTHYIPIPIQLHTIARKWYAYQYHTNINTILYHTNTNTNTIPEDLNSKKDNSSHALIAINSSPDSWIKSLVASRGRSTLSYIEIGCLSILLQLCHKTFCNFRILIQTPIQFLTLVGIQFYDFIFGNEELFGFQPIIPIRSNLGLEYVSELRKRGPRTTRLCS